MKNPGISIIIPVYNGAPTLEACLSSVLAQEFAGFELLLVDNDSTDATATIIRRFSEKDPRIVSCFEKEKSRGAARKAGEKIARGEIIVMTDADCIARDPSWLQKLVSPVLEGGADAVQGSERTVEDNFWSRHIEEKNKRQRKGWTILRGKEIIGTIDTKNFAIRKDLLEEAGLTSERYANGNDTELSIRISRTSCVIVCAENARIVHKDPATFRQFAEKQFDRGFWVALISRDRAADLAGSDFLNATNQTLWSFLKFFPGLLKTLLLEGFGAFFFNLIDGGAWRVGMIYAWLRSRKITS